MSEITRRMFLSAGSGIAGAILLAPEVFAASVRPRRPRRPRIYTRSEWDAAPPRRKATVTDHPPDRIVIHHTATANTGDTSLEAAFRLSRAIQRHHMRRNGWDDIGQHFTVSRGGYILEGRNRTLPAIEQGKLAVGAHVAGHNSRALGIETEGTYIDELPTKAQLNALVALVAWLCATYRLDPQKAIIGHRDLNTTACPGDRLYGYLGRLREDVARRLGTVRSSAARLAVAEEPQPALVEPGDGEEPAEPEPGLIRPVGRKDRDGRTGDDAPEGPRGRGPAAGDGPERLS